MPDARHRVALVTSSFDPHVGGVEEHVRRLAIELRSQGHDVVVWTVDRGEHLGVRTVDGILVRYLPTPLPSLSVTGMGRFVRVAPATWRAWREALRTDEPQLLHVHCFGPNGVYAAALAQLTRTPLVVTSHGETFMDPAAFASAVLLRRGLRYALRRAASVTGVSEVVLSDLRRRSGLVGGSVVPNGGPELPPCPSAESGAPRAPDSDVPHSGAVILALGRLERVKGFDLLIEALPLVRSQLPQTQLRLGGAGSQKSALVALADRLGLSGALTMLGELTPAQVAAEMDSADVVVVPSRREAFGIVLLEAWRSGTALVATDRDGPADLVNDGADGLLVDPMDQRALAAAIVRLLSDPAYAASLATAGRARVADFTWPAVVRAYDQVYAAARASLP